MRVIVLHDNPEWFQPIREAFQEHGVRVEEWVSDVTCVDLGRPPPADAIFYNRCSSSAHTRGRPRSLDQAATILRWLQQHGRVVVNPLTAAELENSKALQYMTALRHGLHVPRTLCTARPTLEIIEKTFGKNKPFLIKPDRGGKGAFIRFFSHADEFRANPEPLQSVTGLYVIQEFIPPTSGVYRVEFVGQRYLYTSVALPQAADCFDPNMCPCDLPESRFKVLVDFAHPVLDQIQELFLATGLENGAVEFILDEAGVPRVVDLNTNTAYNLQAEQRAGAPQGWQTVTRYVVSRLRQAEAELAEQSGQTKQREKYELTEQFVPNGLSEHSEQSQQNWLPELNE